MTRLTWIESEIGPTTLHVSAHEARSYLEQGFEIINYKEGNSVSLGSSSVTIVKPGSECVHTWSPELNALHNFVCRAFDEMYQGLSLRSPKWKRLHDVHHKLFVDMEYHTRLIHVQAHEKATLEEPQAKIVNAIRELANQERGDVKRRLEAMAEKVSAWQYERPILRRRPDRDERRTRA